MKGILAASLFVIAPMAIVAAAGCGDNRPPPSGTQAFDAAPMMAVDSGIVPLKCPSGKIVDAGPGDAADGGAQTGTPAATGPTIGTHRFENADITEVNLVLAAGDVVTACYRASNVIRWDVHGHLGANIVVYESGNADEAQVTWKAPTAGSYSFGWYRGTAGPFGVDVIIVGAGQLDPMTPWFPEP